MKTPDFQIDRLGTYKTRNGDTATIGTTGAMGQFPVRGYIQKAKRREANAWTSSGRALVFGESPDDLVEFVG